LIVDNERGIESKKRTKIFSFAACR